MATTGYSVPSKRISSVSSWELFSPESSYDSEEERKLLRGGRLSTVESDHEEKPPVIPPIDLDSIVAQDDFDNVLDKKMS